MGRLAADKLHSLRAQPRARLVERVDREGEHGAAPNADWVERDRGFASLEGVAREEGELELWVDPEFDVLPQVIQHLNTKRVTIEVARDGHIIDEQPDMCQFHGHGSPPACTR